MSGKIASRNITSSFSRKKPTFSLAQIGLLEMYSFDFPGELLLVNGANALMYQTHPLRAAQSLHA
jgi:hypothetical protein